MTSIDAGGPGRWPFVPGLRAELSANLGRHRRTSIPLDGRRHAAVAIVVVAGDAVGAGGGARFDGESVADGFAPAAFVLTRRSVRLRAHAGQWALPGGRVDEGESVLDAARRELREELDLDLEPDGLLGVLDDYPTRSGYVITPSVWWGGEDRVLHPQPGEVRSVHRVDFDELCRPDSPRFIAIPESDRPVVQIPIGDDLIHAPTGAVLLQFRRVALEGVEARVAHYEQPVFAWR